jgi:microcin C transport system permease protein
MFFISLFADFIANDKPILIKYNEQLYFPIFENIYETEFGGDFETFTDYRDLYITQKIESNGWIIWTPVKYGADTINYELPAPAPTPPTLENILGTDENGRDIFARLIYGLRISMLFGLILSVLSIVFGVIIGGIQGYYGGKIDLIGQRFIEIWSGLPLLFIIITIADFISPSFLSLLIIMLLFSWISVSSLVRTEFLRVRNFEFVSVAKIMGASDLRIIFKHILPNAIISTISTFPFLVAGSIVALSSLDFLGFGLPVGSPSLGELLSEAKNNLEAIWIGLTIFFTLSIILISLLFIGDGLREANSRER